MPALLAQLHEAEAEYLCLKALQDGPENISTSQLERLDGDDLEEKLEKAKDLFHLYQQQQYSQEREIERLNASYDDLVSKTLAGDCMATVISRPTVK